MNFNSVVFENSYNKIFTLPANSEIVSLAEVTFASTATILAPASAKS